MHCTHHLLWISLALTVAPAGNQTPEPLRLGRPVPATVVPAPHRTSIAFSPDGKKLAWMHCQPERAPNDGGGLLIHLWDIDKKLPLVEMKAANDFTYACSPIRFTPNGRMLAAGCFQLTTEHEELAKPGTAVWNNVRVWLVLSGRELSIVQKENGPVQEMWQAVAFSPDGKTLLAVTNKGGRVWKMPEGKVAARFTFGSANNLVLSTDGKLAAGTAADKAVHVWATAGDDAGKEKHQLAGAGRALGFSPDNKRLAIFQDDKVCLWDLETGKEVWAVPGKLAGDDKHGKRFDYAPDGRHLAWNEDGKITVVDVATGKTTTTLKAEPGPLTFSPDGGRMALGCPDGTALVWDLPK